jgi:hypothetical protein
MDWKFRLKKNQYEKKIDKLVPAYDQPNTDMELELINIGEPIVPSMIVALQYFKERLAWTQNKLKDNNSVITTDHLDWQVGAYQNAINSTVNVLNEITHEDFGQDDQAWENWWKDNQ